MILVRIVRSLVLVEGLRMRLWGVICVVVIVVSFMGSGVENCWKCFIFFECWVCVGKRFVILVRMGKSVVGEFVWVKSVWLNFCRKRISVVLFVL